MFRAEQAQGEYFNPLQCFNRKTFGQYREHCVLGYGELGQAEEVVHLPPAESATISVEQLKMLEAALPVLSLPGEEGFQMRGSGRRK